MNLSKPDLKIELSPSQLSRMDKWLHTFYSKCKSRMSDPFVDDRSLKISSADIYNFLMAIDVNEENRFDWFRLKYLSIHQIKKTKIKKRNAFVLEHYKSCEELFTK